jgi:hypothetical protein
MNVRMGNFSPITDIPFFYTELFFQEPPLFLENCINQIQIVFHLKILLISCFGIQSVCPLHLDLKKKKIFILFGIFVTWNFSVYDFCKYILEILNCLNCNQLFNLT